MKLVPKLTAVLVVGMCIVLGINGYYRVRRETAAFEHERASRHRRAAAALSAAMAHTWGLQGEVAAVSIMDAIASGSTSLQARWVRHAKEDDGADSSSSPAVVVTTTTSREGGDAASTLLTHVPIRVDGNLRGYVELREDTRQDRAHARSVIFETAKTAAALVVLSAFLAFLSGHWIVGNPIRRLCEKARRIGRGDFEGPLELGRARTSGGDELTELAREVNAMCDRLKTSLEQLRHADRLVTVGKLASGVAHELGTPLNVVTARAEMMIASPKTSEESREFVRAIQLAGERMTAIISQLLQFARRKTADRARRNVGALVRTPH